MKKKTKIKKINELKPPFSITVKGEDFEDIEKRVEELKEHPDILNHLPDLDELCKLHDSDIPDEDLFKYIRFDQRFMEFPFAREKVRRWRNEKRGDDKHKAFRADTFLKQIYEALADVRQKKKLAVANFRSYIFDCLSAYKSDETKREFLEALTEATGIPLLADQEVHDLYVKADVSKRAIPSLTTLITAKLFGLSEDTVKQYLKKITEVHIDDETTGFALEE